MLDELGVGERINRRHHMVIEAKKQLWLSGPLIIANILEKLIQVVSLMFVGHLGELPLSGASMAVSFAAVTGFSLLSGMGSALDTLCGQAFGAKQYYMLGIYLQRAMLILSLVSIPLAFIWAFTGNILKAIGQDKEISLAATTYARYMIPVIFAYALLQCHQKFLQAQNIVFPMMLCSAFTVIFHIFLCWVLVFKLRIGLKGAAIANSVSYCISVTIIIIYVRLSPSCKETWTGFSKDALHDISSFVKLAIPSALMICLEFWTFEALVLMSGLLPNPKLETSVLAICLNSSTLAFMIPFGIGASVSTRVSNELGAGQPRNAWLAVIVGGIIAILQGVVVGSTLILGRHVWGKLFSNEKDVVNYVAKMMPFLALSNFIDATQSVLTGTARGCGWQKLGVIVNLGAYYVVGIPFSILLAFKFHLKGKGLWLGIICGLFVQVLLLLSITLCTDWEKEANKAVERVNNSIDIHLSNINQGEEERRSDNGH
ncbi:protein DETOXIFICATION 16-like [Dioscorea cayenensis subsp. rotundata]|uniref:Protein DETOXIFICATION n=1 Tax=Dioscorea cayennensis subsp. rotundata TaxID=55577 RepID=A0AB40B6M2_DIOCR|nr:protein DETOXIFICATION 16-like [Dioscorea cayenensis subsp. rotundata]